MVKRPAPPGSVPAGAGRGLAKGPFWLLFFVIFILSPFPFLAAEDVRVVPMDMHLIIDGSAALRAGRDGAVSWLCDHVVDELLREGDRLSIWIAAGRAKRIFSEALSGGDKKEEVKALLRSIVPGDDSADFSGALREAAAITGGGTMVYTLLITGSAAGYSPLSGSDTIDFLRYSRVQEFPGWRAIVAAPGIASRIRNAASAYLN
ncbi:MAG: hypothetical protein LBD78_08990 [Spirochaetaceae bacterium]|nr:hypothetical protein [Spirochaetaceae bacterium]